MGLTYRDIFELLCSYLRGHKPFENIDDEIPAIVSHWMMNRSGNHPYLDNARRKLLDAKLEEISLQYFGDVSTGNETGMDFDNIVQRDVPFCLSAPPLFTFIDLFAGIGGFRMSLQNENGLCVFSSEWDKSAKSTYFNNFGEIPYGDIRQFTGDRFSDEHIEKQIPDHDILAAGFPCQPFSRAGVSARNALGQPHGFACSVQGSLFFDLVRIAKVKKPKVLFLENVRNLVGHDKGRTFKLIKEVITEELGYSFNSDLIDSSPVVPQRRKRCYMVCIKDSTEDFQFPAIQGSPLPLRSALDPLPPDNKYTISDRLWEGHQKRSERNVERGTGFTAGIADLNKPSNTIVARYGKDGKECLIPQEGRNPRMLTPRECARLQGFPEEFVIPDAKTTAYRQFGNSVALPVVELIAEKVVGLVDA